MMEWGSSTTSAHSQNSPNNANNIVQQTHSPSINSNSINETDGKTKIFFSKEENACYLESAKDNGVHTGWPMYWPGPFNYLQIFFDLGFFGLKASL